MASSSILKPYELPENTEGKFKAKCIHCSSVISGSQRVTSNFVTDMKRKHENMLKPTDSRETPASSSDSSNTPKIVTFLKGSSKCCASDPRQVQITDPRQVQITDALVHFIAGDLFPLSTVESPDFRNLMEKADSRYQVPSRKHFSSKLLHEKSAEVRQNLLKQLKRAENVCLTIDLWSNRQMKGFLGITGHYLIDWNMKSVMICCKRVRGRHTSEEVLACFDIGSKIVSIISDNAANMVKAFSLPGFEAVTKSS